MTLVREVIGQAPGRGLKLVNILRLQPRSALAIHFHLAAADSEIAFNSRGIPMADLARKMPESAHMTAFSSTPSDLANEKHYSVIEISKLWALSQKNGTPDL